MQSVNPAHMPTKQKIKYVQRIVAARGTDLRTRYPVLLHQNALGAGVLLFSILGMVTCGWLYIDGVVPWWACLLINALLASLTHELEHDLIHNLYFRKQRTLHNLMLALAWLARPSAVNPWARRQYHLDHHRLSGTEDDLEERITSAGMPWGVLRFFMTGDLVVSLSVMILSETTWRKRLEKLKSGAKAYFPLTVVNWGVWYLFLGFHGVNEIAGLFGSPMTYSETTMAMMAGVDTATVVLIAPNILRTFCLHFISSNIHYYGDIELNNIPQQVQVLMPWWLWPFQVFCFNFGGTHAVHHFAVNEPFYIRQLSAPVAYKAMREIGVRFNDFGSFKRANRWNSPPRSSIE